MKYVILLSPNLPNVTLLHIILMIVILLSVERSNGLAYFFEHQRWRETPYSPELFPRLKPLAAF